MQKYKQITRDPIWGRCAWLANQRNITPEGLQQDTCWPPDSLWAKSLSNKHMIEIYLFSLYSGFLKRNRPKIYDNTSEIHWTNEEILIVCETERQVLVSMIIKNYEFLSPIHCNMSDLLSNISLICTVPIRCAICLCCSGWLPASDHSAHAPRSFTSSDQICLNATTHKLKLESRQSRFQTRSVHWVNLRKVEFRLFFFFFLSRGGENPCHTPRLWFYIRSHIRRTVL